MFKLLYRLTAIVIGYLLAAGVSANVSVMFAATVWGSAWTWVVLFFWIGLTYLTLWFWPFIVAGIGMLFGLLGLTGLVVVAEKWSNWSLERKRRRYLKEK